MGARKDAIAWGPCQHLTALASLPRKWVYLLAEFQTIEDSQLRVAWNYQQGCQQQNTSFDQRKVNGRQT